MKYVKILLSVTIIFVMSFGTTYAQHGKPILGTMDDLLEDELINLRWTREKIMELLAQLEDASKVKPGDVKRGIELANKLMIECFNPDELDIIGIELEGRLLTVRYNMGYMDITVHVNLDTENAFFGKESAGYAKAALTTRGDIAQRMSIDIGRVHINEIDPILHILYEDNILYDGKLTWMPPYPFPSVHCEFTAKVGRYTLVLEYGYGTYDYPWKIPFLDMETPIEEKIPIIIYPPFPYIRNIITLKSFFDKATKRDYVKEAGILLYELLNPERYYMDVESWRTEDRMLKLTIQPFAIRVMWPYSVISIPVEVNLKTGQVDIVDQRIIDCATKSRQETSEKLNIGISDVHLNVIYSHMYRILIYPPPPPTYYVNISTPQFRLSYTYYSGNGSLELVSLTNIHTGQDLLGNATEYMRKIFNPEEMNLTDYGLDDAGNIWFDFAVGYSTMRATVNIETGEVSIPEGMEETIKLAKEDLASLLSINPDEIQVKSTEFANWSDGSLGYPEPGMSYIQVFIPGFCIILSYDGKDYEYHTDMNGYVKLDPAVRKEIEIGEYIRIAKEDLARRLRLPIDEIEVLKDEEIIGIIVGKIPIISDGGIYVITLLHRYSDIRPLVLGELGQITPQPYGTYTYHIRFNGDRIGVPRYQIIKVSYFDGSYDEYVYHWGLFIGKIEQYDKDGNHKATISYMKDDQPQERIQTITHYELNENGEEVVKYEDIYKYALSISDPEWSGIRVVRFKGKDWTQEICAFWYEGKKGLERLVKCEFPNGLYIIYERDLAQKVYDTNSGDNQPIMWFTYDFDEYGNILRTHVYFSNNILPVVYEGLADPVDIVVGYIGKIEELLKIAENYLNEIVNPDEFTLDDWRVEDGSIRFSFKLQDGSIVDIHVNIDTGEPWMEEGLKDAVLKTREDIAKRMGVDVEEVHINRFEMLYHIMVVYPYPYSWPSYEITARVDNYTLSLLCYTDYYKLTSFVDNRTKRDYVAEAENQILDLFNPQWSILSVQDWQAVDGLLLLSISLFDAESIGHEIIMPPYPVGGVIPVSINLETGEIKIDQNIVDAVKKVREETSERLDINISDVHVNGISQGLTLTTHDIPPSHISTTYYLYVTTPEFYLEYRYTIGYYLSDRENEVYNVEKYLELTSLVNRETNQDLLQKAIEHLEEIFTTEEFELIDWGIGKDNTISFTFNLTHGSVVEIKIDIDTAVLREMIQTREIYDDSERLISKNINTYEYDRNGTLREEKKELYWYWYDNEGNLSRSSYEIKAKEYDEAGRLINDKWEYTWYDGDGNQIIRNSFVWTYTYDENGILREELAEYKYYDENDNLDWLIREKDTYDENGTRREHRREIYQYDDNGNYIQEHIYVTVFNENGTFTDSYGMISRYDENGKLIAMNANITIANSGETVNYRVAYDIDEDGNITYTHVYDMEGNEIDVVSGYGFIHPFDIIDFMNGPPAPEILDKEEPYVDLSNEMLERKSIEEEVEQQASNPLFTSQMADEPDKILPIEK